MLVGKKHVNKKDASSPCWASERTQWIKAFAINPDQDPHGRRKPLLPGIIYLSMCTFISHTQRMKECMRKTLKGNKTNHLQQKGKNPKPTFICSISESLM